MSVDVWRSPTPSSGTSAERSGSRFGDVTTEHSLSDLRQRAGKLVAMRAFADAIPIYLYLREALVERFGEENANVALVDETLGGVARAAGDLDLARRFFEAARGIHATVDPLRASSIDEVLRYLDPLPTEVLRERPSLRLEHDGAFYEVDRDVYFIGRGIERVHLYIHSDMLSRVHARVVWENGTFLFEDCRSENGTFFEERMLRTPHAIRDRDVFLAGGRVRLIAHLGAKP